MLATHLLVLENSTNNIYCALFVDTSDIDNMRAVIFTDDGILLIFRR